MTNITYITVRDPKWVNDKRLQIFCTVKFGHIEEEVPFVADPNDAEPHGREIFKRASAGEFGVVGFAASSDFVNVELTSGEYPLKMYIDEANKENRSGTERGVVLVWASIIDEMLRNILDAFTADIADKDQSLFGNQAPFGTFSSRTKAALALGLIAVDEAALINQVRKIRNDFAHRIDVDLSDGALSSKCYDLCSLATGEKYIGQPKLSFTAGCGRIMILLDHHLARARSMKLPLFSDNTPLKDRFM